LIEDGDVYDRRRRGLADQHGGVGPQQHRDAKRAKSYHPISVLNPV
jgi:hypothetical protein